MNAQQQLTTTTDYATQLAGTFVRKIHSEADLTQTFFKTTSNDWVRTSYPGLKDPSVLKRYTNEEMADIATTVLYAPDDLSNKNNMFKTYAVHESVLDELAIESIICDDSKYPVQLMKLPHADNLFTPSGPCSGLMVTSTVTIFSAPESRPEFSIAPNFRTTIQALRQTPQGMPEGLFFLPGLSRAHAGKDLKEQRQHSCVRKHM